MTARPKHAYIRSKHLMVAYRAIPCQHCGRDDGTVCGAHSNQGAHGKGKGIKADDHQAASLCHSCHMELDQGRALSEMERLAMWRKAQAKTFQTLLARGLWPVEVPFPEIDTSLLEQYQE